jgi:hypothetical protein
MSPEGEYNMGTSTPNLVASAALHPMWLFHSQVEIAYLHRQGSLREHNIYCSTRSRGPGMFGVCPLCLPTYSEGCSAVTVPQWDRGLLHLFHPDAFPQ